MKYSDIHNIEGLDETRRQLKGQIGDKRRELSLGADELREACTPSAIIASAVHAVSSSVPFDRIALWAIRRLKSRL